MNGTNLVLDTNIIIYYSDNNRVAYELIANNQIFISVITEMEMLSYFHDTEEDYENVKKLLSLFTIVQLNSFIREKAILLRKKYRLKLPDAIISATSMYLDCSIVTAEKKILKMKEINAIEFKVL